MKDSGAPGIGDIVQVLHATSRMGLVVEVRGSQVGIRYFKPSMVNGVPPDHIWWLHRKNVKIVSPSGKTEKV